jgi:beta-phosphoglucomutase-like phosphatase (HAD superfamily)
MTLEIDAGRVKGLIFDCDGTLVDTAPAHYAALMAGLKAMGLTMDIDWYFERAGLTPAVLFDKFEEMVGPFDRKRLIADYTVAYQGALAELREVEVIGAIARAWKGKLPMAVGSNGTRLNVETTLRTVGLLELFDTVVVAADVAEGKPAPDVFLEAARRMGVAPDLCVVFEDTDEGLEAAHRAEMDGRDIREVFTPAWKKR